MALGNVGGRKRLLSRGPGSGTVDLGLEEEQVKEKEEEKEKEQEGVAKKRKIEKDEQARVESDLVSSILDCIDQAELRQNR